VFLAENRSKKQAEIQRKPAVLLLEMLIIEPCLLPVTEGLKLE
jgi:hypothetical protein